MKKIVGIASYMYKHCQKDGGSVISEAKLQRLMYLLQREALVQNGEPIFAEPFNVLNGSPELKIVRFMYDNRKLNIDIDRHLVDKFRTAFEMIFRHYAPKSIWSLNNLTSCENSWKEIEENKVSLITVKEIRIDAKKVRERREAMLLIRGNGTCVVKKITDELNYEITESQRDLIKKIKCERLCDNSDNRIWIKYFYNKTNRDIGEKIRKESWREDEKNGVRYYVVKIDEIIVLCFSIKCGSLYKQLDPPRESLIIQMNNTNCTTLNGYPKMGKESDFKAAKNICDAFSWDIQTVAVEAFYFKKDIDMGEIHVKRTNQTFPGVEIVLFCKNDDPRAIDAWERMGLPHSLGTIVFFEKILPIILEVRKNIGCEYVFLFAADSSDDRDLVNFYINRLKLKEPDDLGTMKPKYDWTSFFLYRKISKIETYLKEFHKEFNKKEE